MGVSDEQAVTEFISSYEELAHRGGQVREMARRDALAADIYGEIIQAGATDGLLGAITLNSAVQNLHSKHVWKRALVAASTYTSQERKIHGTTFPGPWSLVLDEVRAVGRSRGWMTTDLETSAELASWTDEQRDRLEGQLESEIASTKRQGCYVASAVYGSYDAPEVWTLRRYRDRTLRRTPLGRAFIRVYYYVSPGLVKWGGAPLRTVARPILDITVRHLRVRGMSSDRYEDVSKP